jgi:hypothetical protein
MAEVRSMFGQPIVPHEPCEKLVAGLEDLLEKARAGEITGLAAGWVTRSGKFGTFWDGDADTPVPLMVSVTALYRRFSDFVIE